MLGTVQGQLAGDGTPSIMIANQSNRDSSAAIHWRIRSADNATNRRDTADVTTSAPDGAAISPSAGRTTRPKWRVPTLIRIRGCLGDGGGSSPNPRANRRLVPPTYSARGYSGTVAAGTHVVPIYRHLGAVEAQIAGGTR
jgi:hypothetical protein